jgi:transposase
MATVAVPLDAALPDDPETLKGMIRELLAALHDKDRALSGVQHRLDQLLRRLYGPKSERFRPDQPDLFDHLLPPEPDAPADEPATTTPNQPRRGKKHGRRRLPADLQRERLVHDLPEVDKVCPCCQQPRVPIGEEVSEQLDYRPAKLFVWQHVRLKYACPACLANACATEPAAAPDAPVPDASLVIEPTSTVADATPAPLAPAPSLADPLALIVTAPKPAQPIDKGLPGPGLLAYVITSKYADHLPLHRQEAILARHGVALSRSTLCDWMAAAASLLTPLYALMLQQVLASRVIQTDETRVPVQDPSLDKTRSGRLWAFIGDRDHPHTVYDYTPTKVRDGPAAILANYTGFLQADAANVFDGIYLPGAITEVACWAHARRHFHDARDSDAAGSAEALARIRVFYAIEDEAKTAIEKAKLTGDAADALRLRLRQEKTAPRLVEFAAWMEEQAKIVLPKSPMGQAIAYAQRQWQALLRFTQHGFLNIDNNAAERAMRAVAIGRKNYLFVGSDNGGKTAAVLYTMTQTAKRHQIDPFAYLQDVLRRLPDLPASRLDELLPNRWAQAQREQVVTTD